MPKVIASQMSCGAQSMGLSCGTLASGPCFGTGELEHEEDDERHHEAEQAGCFRKREAEQKIGKLPRRRRRIAKRALQIIAENGADADARADECDRGKACSDQFRC